MSGSDALLQQRKEGTLMPATDAPELLAMPGSVLLRGNAASVPHGHRRDKNKQKAEGADFIKTIDVTSEGLFCSFG